MIAAIKMILEECEDTESDVLFLADNLQAYGFDKLQKVTSLVDIINRRNGRGGYSRV